jgi:cell division protein FtsB
VGCLGLWALFNVENLRQLGEAQADRDAAAATVESLRASLGQMQAEREALNTNLRAIERAAREQFKFTYPGEQLVLIEREVPLESGRQISEEIDDIESLTNLPEAL